MRWNFTNGKKSNCCKVTQGPNHYEMDRGVNEARPYMLNIRTKMDQCILASTEAAIVRISFGNIYIEVLKKERMKLIKVCHI